MTSSALPECPDVSASTSAVRASRGLGAAAFSTFVALISHVLAGGEIPAVLGIAVPLVLAAPACLALARLRRSWLRMSISVGVSQLLFHTLFVLGTTASASADVVSTGGPHADHGAQTALIVVTARDPMTHVSHGGAGMWVAHALAGLVTIVVLQRAEAVLSRLARLSGRLVGFLIPAEVRAVALPTPSRSAVSSDAGTWIAVARSVVSGGVVRRGPPVLSPI